MWKSSSSLLRQSVTSAIRFNNNPRYCGRLASSAPLHSSFSTCSAVRGDAGEGGAVLSPGDQVYRHHDKLVDLTRTAVPVGLTPVDDPRMEELKKLQEKNKELEMLAHKQVVDLFRRAMPLALALEDDPRRKELKKLQEKKEELDMLAHKQVERILWSGIGAGGGSRISYSGMEGKEAIGFKDLLQVCKSIRASKPPGVAAAFAHVIDKEHGPLSNMEGNARESQNILRPLSPHLPIYKPQLSSTTSIFHRISGAFLTTIILSFYLFCLKMGPICFTYESFYQFFFYSSNLIQISAEISALALSYHIYIGLRHFLTDFSGFLSLRKMLK